MFPGNLAVRWIECFSSGRNSALYQTVSYETVWLGGTLQQKYVVNHASMNNRTAYKEASLRSWLHHLR